ncbi:hypothetical protein [Dactylosporangium sp. NPDC006015]|uniref:hypothetical protein n=1 Tax=Dactylosporangium sp. NPDC006015 TaxID=3154576 RepID=UPI0033ACC3F7
MGQHVFVAQGLYRILVGACQVAKSRQQATIGADDIQESMRRRIPNFVPGRLAGAGPLADRPGGWAGFEVAATLRQARWEAFRSPGRRRPGDAIHWGDDVPAAIRRAIDLAPPARPAVGTGDLAAVLFTGYSALPGTGGIAWPKDDDRPLRPLTDYLLHWRYVTPDPQPQQKPPARWVSAYTSLTAGADVVLANLELEAIRQAVRLGRDRVTTADLVLAVAAFEDELAARRLRPVQAHRSLLTVRGLTSADAALAATTATDTDDPAVAGPARRRAWRTNPNNPPWSTAAAAAADQARTTAAAAGVPAGSAQLLSAALTVPDNAAWTLLRALHTDPSEVLRDAA